MSRITVAITDAETRSLKEIKKRPRISGRASLRRDMGLASFRPHEDARLRETSGSDKIKELIIPT